MMCYTFYNLRKLLKPVKIFQVFAVIFIFGVATRIYVALDEIPKEVTEESKFVTVINATEKIMTTATSTPKTTKMVSKVGAVQRTARIVAKSRRYRLSAFKEYLNGSVPSPMDHHDLTYLLEPSGICDKKMDFVIIIHSAAKNKERRDVLRFTIGRYANKAKLKYKMFFVTGIPHSKSTSHTVDLLRENTEFGDLLVMDVIDSYRNMTFKAISWIKWMTEYCEQKPNYILKMDDDGLLKLPLLIEMLIPCFRSTNGAICRHLSCMVRPKEPSLRYGKNKVTFNEYPFRHYPPMCPGLMYLMPGSFAERMLNASEHVPFIWLDDVYVTVFLRIYINEQLNSLRRFFMHPHDKNFNQLYTKKMVAHLQSKTFVTDYIKIWNKMINEPNPS